ncbi:DUF4339 domain-containing protein [Corallococcus sp. CA053C]|uniref:adventurous gliding motility protein GltJ n=1 Tax=Corallococcus sp. CA053C TaxID=2316732 RepID=UPI000EA1ACD9|nr:adventurous gliding motility protein GltJ [Corallococcus sp. CA053C]RKH14167.1 DUF4339 domain-containing protein [Corallococcus sp. CA053C]
MRFVCDSCRAQYMISDDKVGPKGVKLRCKKCGHTILVRPAGASAAKEGGADTPASTEAKSATPDSNAPRIVESSGTGLPATLGTPPEGGLFTDVEEDEIGAVFDQVLSTGSQKIQARDAEAEAVKAAKAETVRKLAEAEAAESTMDDAKAASHEWYVAIDEKQVGPWSVEKVKDAWDRGEVGPDNLCWRSGFGDWIPLSETAELASVLAPRPAKPVIVAPAPVTASSPTIPAGPVESAFSAGNSRPGLGGASAAPEEPVGWKPSAASVLASLVKEENDALTKPPPRPAPSLEREPLSQSRLLDVPMPPPEPKSSPAMPVAMMGAASGMAAPAAYAPQQPAYPQQPVQQYAPQQPAYPQQQAQMPYGQQPQGYPPPGYPAAYPPPAAAPTGGGKGRTGMLVAVTAGVLVIAGAAVVYVARGNSSERPVDPPTQVAVAPTRQPELPPMPPPPAAVQPAATPTATAPVAAGTPAAAVAGAPAAGTPVAAGTPPATAPAVAAAPAVVTPPPPAVVQPPATTPNMGTAVAKLEPRTQRRTGGSGSSGSRGSSHEDDEAITVSKPTAAASSSNSGGGDDDFDELFGTKKPAAATKPATKTSTVYVPPEPGGGTLERLQQSDIMQVVLNNKPAIMKCVNEQRQKDPSLSGKLVMRWTVQTSGKTTSVSCRTDEFRSSYMATCITGIIKGWSFPKHQKQGDPIDFPFTF